MAVEKSYARLGLFLVVLLVVGLITTAIVIDRLRSRSVIAFVTYTTDNVTGLEVSRPVRYRGVTLGQVTDVRVDTHNNAVEIDFEVFLDRLAGFGVAATRVKAQVAQGALQTFRTQIISNPVTGEAYLLLDQPTNPPPPMTLGFTPARPYVASMPTPLETAASRLPEVLDRAETTLRTVTDIIARIPASLDRSDRFFTNVEQIMHDSQLPELSAQSRKFFTTTSEQIAQMSADVDRLLGTGGTLVKFADDVRGSVTAADLPATTESTRHAMNGLGLAADELRGALPAIRDSLTQLRELARQLQEQPESMVYGRRPPKGKDE
jgi:paraquat-inducible protein B